MNVSKECLVEVKNPNTYNTALIGYRCKKDGRITQKPNPTLEGWTAKKGYGAELDLFCPAHEYLQRKNLAGFP